MGYTGVSIVDYLKSVNRDSSFSARKKLAAEYGIGGYTGTASENSALLKLLREGTGAAAPSLPAPKEYEKIEGSKPSYSASEAAKAAEALLKEYEGKKPGEYVSPYEAELKKILEQAGNTSFSYEAGRDPLYQAYREQYTRGGKKAMEDTAAKMSALTGGYGNSYATTAASEAYQDYLSELNYVIPELYDAAYSRYQGEKSGLYERASTLASLGQADYQTYRGSVEDYYNDLSYYYQKYGDLSETEYAKYLKDLDQWEKDRSYYYEKHLDELEQQNKEAQLALAQAKKASSSSRSSSSSSSAKKTAEAQTKTTGTGKAGSGNMSAYELVAWGVQNLQTPRLIALYIENAVSGGRITKAEGKRLLAERMANLS